MRRFLHFASIVALSALLITACGRSGSHQRIQNNGSDTLVNVALAWAETYKTVNPSVEISVSGGGSGTGISSLINGTVDIANSSRRLKDREIEQARARGFEPKEWVVGHDAIVLFVHRNNPLESISLAQLAEIYGEGGKSSRWSDLGVTIPGVRDDVIVRVSRQNSSGTYAFFKDAVLGNKRDFKLDSRELHGSKDVVHLVETTPGAIGYSGLAYATESVKMLPIEKADGAIIAPSTDTALDGSYPIARPLLMYTRGEATGHVKTYLDWIMSDAGQLLIEKMGYAPIRPLK